MGARKTAKNPPIAKNATNSIRFTSFSVMVTDIIVLSNQITLKLYELCHRSYYVLVVLLFLVGFFVAFCGLFARLVGAFLSFLGEAFEASIFCFLGLIFAVLAADSSAKVMDIDREVGGSIEVCATCCSVF